MHLVRYIRDCSGSISMAMALVLPVLLVSAGMVADVTNAMKLRAQLQTNLDAAALEVITRVNSDSEIRSHIEERVLRSFGHAVSAEVLPSQTQTTSKIQVQMSYNVPNVFSGILGKKTTRISVSTTVSMNLELDRFRVRSLFAQGEYHKTMSLMVRRSGAAVDSKVAEYIYDADTGSVAGPTGWVDMGLYEQAYFRMEIDPTSEGFDEHCAGCPTELRTDEPDYSDRLFVNSVKMPPNTRIDIFQTIECGGTTNHGWEDGGGHDTDFRFAFDAECRTNRRSVPRITN